MNANNTLSPRRLPLAFRLKRPLPRSLFGRTLLIIVVPTFVMLAAATYVFFDRHWYTVTTRMTHALAGDIAFITDLLQKSNNPGSTAEVMRAQPQSSGCIPTPWPAWCVRSICNPPLNI